MIELKSIVMPDFGVPLARPAIPGETYARRCDAAYKAAGRDWLFVYADREHNANILHLTGFDPRFEEAILLLGPNGKRIVVAGNESISYTALSPLPGLEVVLAQTLSLMAQDRMQKPNLEAVLRDAGLKPGDSIGVVGWKYLEADEWDDARTGYLIPHYMAVILQRIAGSVEAVTDATAVLMHPQNGQRAIVDADQIAAFEWASARASAAVWRMVSGARPGEAELMAASRMGYAGEPLSCHVMFSGAGTDGVVHGLASPSARLLKKGGGVTTAVGYWGSLSSRAGLLDTGDDAFLPIAKAYFAGLVEWYETADIGVAGGDIHAAVVDRLAEGGLKPALNPGHLVSYDEWMHSPIRPGSRETIRSGMPFQVDIIPTPTPAGAALNCEDAVAFADEALRGELQAKHPEVWSRIEARRTFVRDQLGVAIKPSILPLSNIQLCLAPFWLVSSQLLVRS
jgi:Xaa-Pro aminopeptidase